MGYFLPYQERWVNDNATLKLYEKSRRIGVTYATSFRSVLKCLYEKKGSSFVQWVSSRDELTAKEFITDYVATWAREANKISRGLASAAAGAVGLDGRNVEVVDEKNGITAFVVRFKNGSRICSISSNPMAFAGKGGDILIDEMDLHLDQETLYAMAYPCITWGGQLEIVSAYSADGSEHTEFARLCRECKAGGNPRGFSFHRTTLDDAIDQGFVEKVNESKAARGRPAQTREEFRSQLRRGCITLGAWLSQYMCEPNSASGGQLIAPLDLSAAQQDYEMHRLHLVGDAGIDDVTDPSCAPYLGAEFWLAALPAGKRYAVGWDIARSGDLTSIAVNRQEGDGYELALLMTMKGCKYETQRRLMLALLGAHGLAVGCGDNTGPGQSDCEAVETRYPDRFRGINFSASKLALGTTMRSVFEQRRQRLPIRHPEIAADLAAIRTAATAGGRLTFTETRNELLPDSHCDIGWSCALALFAGETIDHGGPCLLMPAREPAGYNVPDDGYHRPDHSDDYQGMTTYA